MNKKGAIQEIQALITPLIGVAIVLVIGFLIFAETKEQVVSITGVTTTHINETISSFTTNVTVVLEFMNCMDTLSCSQLLNSTGEELSANSYSCDSSGIYISNDSSVYGMTTSLNVTYSCKHPTLAYNATGEIQNATQEIPGWLPIIIITVIGAILLGLVAYFRRR